MTASRLEPLTPTSDAHCQLTLHTGVCYASQQCIFFLFLKCLKLTDLGIGRIFAKEPRSVDLW